MHHTLNIENKLVRCQIIAIPQSVADLINVHIVECFCSVHISDHPIVITSKPCESETRGILFTSSQQRNILIILMVSHSQRRKYDNRLPESLISLPEKIH